MSFRRPPSADPHAPLPTPRSQCRARNWLWLLPLTWCLAQVWLAKDDSVTVGWNSWRQTQTQSIARHFFETGIDLPHPAVAWGGTGSGWVEAECQLYTGLIAVVAQAIGSCSEWIGRGVSLLGFALAGLVLFSALSRRFGRVPAVVGWIGFSCNPNVMLLSTAVMPESLSVAAFVVALAAFDRVLDAPRGSRTAVTALLVTALSTAVAALIKVTALHLGIWQFLTAAWLRRDLLGWRSPLWLAWLVILAIAAAQLWHGQDLYHRTGNTFGIWAGGDTKFPQLRHLLSPRLWLQAATLTVLFGVGIGGAIAAAVIWRSPRLRFEVREWALAAAHLTLVAVAFRYSSSIGAGTHYHVFAAPLGAWLIAHAVQLSSRRVTVIAALFLTIGGFAATILARDIEPSPEYFAGRQLAAAVSPGELVAVRSRFDRHDSEWQRRNNFEDPRVFYLARVRGWSLAADETGASRLAECAAAGARYYVEPATTSKDRELEEWLAHHARLIQTWSNGRLFALP